MFPKDFYSNEQSRLNPIVAWFCYVFITTALWISVRQMGKDRVLITARGPTIDTLVPPDRFRGELNPRSKFRSRRAIGANLALVTQRKPEALANPRLLFQVKNAEPFPEEPK
ncbi:hypothetical protein AVEN_143698-1 [Araneus ventricosus]|uniref:Uncharacterized protein n=1 Tax=Araneus ventricosus TaxID=182803 RepID=A0A4Y2ANU8_ARAVE|nr:hypothetical protein AVEN_143698-1 [Araneus ventricosus]